MCWYCHDDISSLTNERCDVCGWFICKRCGACEHYCFGRATSFRSERSKLREIYLSLPFDERPPVLEWSEENLPAVQEILRIEAEKELAERRKIAAERARVEKLEAERIAAEHALYLENLRNAVCERGAFSTKFGLGSFVRFYCAGKDCLLEVMFDGANKSFVFPQAFERGYLTIPD